MEDILKLITEETFIISDTHFQHRNILEFEPCRLTQMRIDGYEANEHDKWLIDNWNAVVNKEDLVLHLGDFSFKQLVNKEITLSLYRRYREYTKSSIIHICQNNVIVTISDLIDYNGEYSGGILDMEEFKSVIKKYTRLEEKDLSDRPEDLLNGEIIMVLGNHDLKPKNYLNRNITIIDGFYSYIDKNKTVLNKVITPDNLFSGFIKSFGDKKIMFSHYPVFNKDDWDRKNKMIAPRIKVLETIFSANSCNLNIHGHIHSNLSTFKHSKNVSTEHIGFRPVKIKTILKEIK